ncbi:POTRA domain-containing protein, partial [Staphylococcus pasteuri_A]
AQTFPENSSVRRISSASAEQTKRALRALGYYQSKIDVSEKEKDVYLVEVELGERLVISKFDFTFEGEANKDSRFTSAVTK